MSEVAFSPNSLLYWFPKVLASGVPAPRTGIVMVGHLNLWELLDGTDPFTEETKRSLVAVGRAVGYPLFLRTDILANKHDWKDSCYVPDEEVLFQHIFSLVERHALAFGIPDPQALVFRELLAVRPAFHAFNGLPISRERRYFVRGGRVVCAHPNWPEDAIRNTDASNWKELLADLSSQSVGEQIILSRWACQVSGVLPGYWSVDFLETKSDGWFLIDMAKGENSFHPTCPHKLPPEDVE